MVVALAIVAAIGDVGRFEQSQKLVSYLGLNPSVRQSGPGPAYHGRITKQGRGHARGMLVEAAGRQRERRVRCVRSSCESAPAAVSMSPLSRRPVSSRCSSGIC
jgi:transposase